MLGPDRRYPPRAPCGLRRLPEIAPDVCAITAVVRGRTPQPHIWSALRTGAAASVRTGVVAYV